jgi:hypothetical protein
VTPSNLNLCATNFAGFHHVQPDPACAALTTLLVRFVGFAHTRFENFGGFATAATASQSK